MELILEGRETNLLKAFWKRKIKNLDLCFIKIQYQWQLGEFIHSFIHSPIYASIHAFIHSFIRLLRASTDLGTSDTAEKKKMFLPPSPGQVWC